MGFTEEEAVEKFKEFERDDKIKNYINFARICAAEELALLDKTMPGFYTKIAGDNKGNQWCFYFVVSLVWWMITFLEGSDLPIKTAVVLKFFEEWDSRAGACLDNLVEFVNNTRVDEHNSIEEIKKHSMGAVGLWMVWNLTSKKPTEACYKTANVLGLMVFMYAEGYWGKSKGKKI